MLIARYPPVIGGAEIQCSRLSQWLVRQGHQVTVLTERSSPQLAARESLNGLEIIRFPSRGTPPFSSLMYGLQVFWFLITHQSFDIYHAHMIATPALTALAASKITHVPVLIKIAGGRQTGDFGTSRRTRRGHLKLWLLKRSQPYVVCPSEETRNEALSLALSREKLRLIPNGIDCLHFKPIEKAKKMSSFQAIYVGRWAKGKGVEKLLMLWEKGVQRSDFPWNLQLVLSESVPQEYPERLRVLEKRIFQATCVQDPISYYQASDLALLLSEGEGLSNFVLEAMACGLPAIVSKAAALPGTSNDSQGTCTLAEKGSEIDETIEHMVQWAREPTRLREKGQAARQYVMQHFSMDHVGQTYVDLYEEMRRQR